MQATRTGEFTFSDYIERVVREAGVWVLVAVAAFLALSLATYAPGDPGWSYVGPESQVSNAAGRAGAWFADVAFFLFGLFAYLIPLMLVASALLLFQCREQEPETRLLRLALHWLGAAMTLVAATALASAQFDALLGWLPTGLGGGLGRLGADWTQSLFGGTGRVFFLFLLLLIGVSLVTGMSPLAIVDAVGEFTLWLTALMLAVLRRLGAGEMATDADLESDVYAEAQQAEEGRFGRFYRRLQRPRADDDPDPSFGDLDAFDGEADIIDETMVRVPWEPEPDIPAATQAPASATRADSPRPEAQSDAQRPVYRSATPKSASVTPKVKPGDPMCPPFELLDPARPGRRGYTPDQLEELSREVETRLADYGVTAKVVAVQPGPVVALFELELAPGVKAAKITGLARDLARALSKVSVRVVEIIPGKSVIGLEIPNDSRDMVVLSEVLNSDAYRKPDSALTIGLGTDIGGQPVVADLGSMPHALIAGTTGSGKSVAINAMILSLLYKAEPKDVRLIMVDPKMLELSVYNGIPHLLTPVVTDMKEAANALRWCVAEMERRYRLMSELKVRNIGGFNKVIKQATDAGEAIIDPVALAAAGGELDPDLPPPTLSHLPYIVVIIDELADMMMVVGKKVEELIVRLAQKARASGIHLLLATQRPSVDVLTGLIKANVPTRMAFKVSSRVDSRTILDQMGAEQLLGHGDMLYMPPGSSIPQRVHGAFVDDHEVHKVVDHLKQFGPPEFIDTVLQESSDFLTGIDAEPSAGGDVEDKDALFDEAVQIVVETRRASISGVQRRLKIGYNRAARMIEEMERIGVVGPAETNGNREVLAPPPASED
ncbi:DNA translocase FtsK [Thiorhodovibrio frisius]|uniref:DNA translocase FtsK n=1 Tax=Thiorhodovibrio frisius TaxID=631362 RepID=H8Z358_9GAMM|nr:DNA translocase FtsK [Thiorhodovibrio frisius]EIC21766.1 DNA segregation ATPase, FtsK/SpoIIIE family [Thiorhodovibrio frisius]WPL21732.1 DNA translocase FtsK [Thiorhodovibrio frisius]